MTEENPMITVLLLAFAVGTWIGAGIEITRLIRHTRRPTPWGRP